MCKLLQGEVSWFSHVQPTKGLSKHFLPAVLVPPHPGRSTGDCSGIPAIVIEQWFNFLTAGA